MSDTRWASPDRRPTNLTAHHTICASTPPNVPRTPSKARPRKKATTDRFIPSRSVNPEVSHFNLTKEPSCPLHTQERERQNYEQLVSRSLLNGRNQKRVLNFVAQPTPRAERFERGVRRAFEMNRVVNPRGCSRYISENPERILDAPELMDDFYLNLLDWNKNGILAVALGPVSYTHLTLPTKRIV
eukprot:TRINITY_DN5647_c0_g1_i1.p1 TRINITY_DN5647_c0_g1~~TRINITY_DN5647_c0_g1_i1.p1  ORF type:complete len:186 (-),score=17.40 TRINITY_DN5647_c0_g1_i1:89-646(-)